MQIAPRRVQTIVIQRPLGIPVVHVPCSLKSTSSIPCCPPNKLPIPALPKPKSSESKMSCTKKGMKAQDGEPKSAKMKVNAEESRKSRAAPSHMGLRHDKMDAGPAVKPKESALQFGSWEVRKVEDSRTHCILDVRQDARKNLGAPSKYVRPSVVAAPVVLLGPPVSRASSVTSCENLTPTKSSGADHIRVLKFTPESEKKGIMCTNESPEQEVVSVGTASCETVPEDLEGACKTNPRDGVQKPDEPEQHALSMPSDLTSMFGMKGQSPPDEPVDSRNRQNSLTTINLKDLEETKESLKSKKQNPTRNPHFAVSCKHQSAQETENTVSHSELQPHNSNKKVVTIPCKPQIYCAETSVIGTGSPIRNFFKSGTVPESCINLMTASETTKEKETAQALLELAAQSFESGSSQDSTRELKDMRASTTGADSLMTWAVETIDAQMSATSGTDSEYSGERRLSDSDISTIREKRIRYKLTNDRKSPEEIPAGICESSTGEVPCIGDTGQDLGAVNAKDYPPVEVDRIAKSVHFREPVAASPLYYAINENSRESTTSERSNSGAGSSQPSDLLEKSARSLDLTNLIKAGADLLGKPTPKSPVKTVVFSPQKPPTKSAFLAKFIQSGLGSGPVPKSILKSPCAKASSPRASELMKLKSQPSSHLRGVKRPLSSEEDNSETSQQVCTHLVQAPQALSYDLLSCLQF